ncbi:hypothetical protein Cs7R123_27030 [Catellatospora sp. TT07R-123]|uniref:hypothetical protein n=1 Tax=Catellatospora sp. TT07R-123 TaxID=2733863 RepID=UPI001B12322F|nr:hypothetical protein [Catellatospora sp. TT07R-123]GHJ45361.1 hypothetical protein Cs7R123_27030 [Catellatospora sp. TT07R-123]
MVEAQQQHLLTRLSRIGRLPAFLGTLVVLGAALLLPAPYGGILLLLLAGALAGLLSTTWRVQPASTRALRVTVLALLVAAAALRLTH